MLAIRNVTYRWTSLIDPALRHCGFFTGGGADQIFLTQT
jgi:hypothetical protein